MRPWSWSSSRRTKAFDSILAKMRFLVLCTVLYVQSTRDGERKCNSASAKLELNGASYRKADPRGISANLVEMGNINARPTFSCLPAKASREKSIVK
jgi:hypothetical protein